MKLTAQRERSGFDCHAGTSITARQCLVPHYSTIPKFSQDNYPEIVGGLADGWTVSDDLKNVVISLLQGVRCHDGWEFTRCENYLRAHRQHAGGVVSVGGAHHHTIDFQFDWRGRPGQPALRPRLWVGLPSEAGGSMTAGTNDAAAASIDIARL